MRRQHAHRDSCPGASLAAPLILLQEPAVLCALRAGFHAAPAGLGSLPFLRGQEGLIRCLAWPLPPAAVRCVSPSTYLRLRFLDAASIQAKVCGGGEGIGTIEPLFPNIRNATAKLPLQCCPPLACSGVRVASPWRCVLCSAALGMWWLEKRIAQRELEHLPGACESVRPLARTSALCTLHRPAHWPLPVAPPALNKRNPPPPALRALRSSPRC